jgi:hypothetical protein
MPLPAVRLTSRPTKSSKTCPGIAASPEQIETQAEPSRRTAPIERHDAFTSSDMPPGAIAKMVPLPVPRLAAVAKASTPKTAARVAMQIGDTLVTLMPRLVTRSSNYLNLLAGGPGFEPGLTESDGVFGRSACPSWG